MVFGRTTCEVQHLLSESLFLHPSVNLFVCHTHESIGVQDWVFHTNSLVFPFLLLLVFIPIPVHLPDRITVPSRENSRIS